LETLILQTTAAQRAGLTDVAWSFVERLPRIKVDFSLQIEAMFGKKKPEPEQPTQSQTMSNVSFTGGGMVQQAQAGRDLHQIQSDNQQPQQQGITGAEVVKLLESFESAIKASSLSATQQEELLDYLRPAKREAGKDSPNKELVGQNLRQVSDTLKMLKDLTEAGKSLWNTGKDILQAIAPWLGVALHFFGG
jgi:hypothetical protein